MLSEHVQIRNICLCTNSHIYLYFYICAYILNNLSSWYHQSAQYSLQPSPFPYFYISISDYGKPDSHYLSGIHLFLQCYYTYKIVTELLIHTLIDLLTRAWCLCTGLFWVLLLFFGLTLWYPIKIRFFQSYSDQALPSPSPSVKCYLFVMPLGSFFLAIYTPFWHLYILVNLICLVHETLLWLLESEL